MARTGRPGLSAGQKQELWQRWRAGESPSEIARSLGKHAASIHGIAKAVGGIPPRERRRAAVTLTLSEREEISRGLAGAQPLRAIARRLGRAPSTVSREVARNGGGARYRAGPADAHAWDQARRPKACALSRLAPLRQLVAEKLALEWSPEQVAGWLRQTFPRASGWWLSHETIYRSLYVQTRAVLARSLLQHLRVRRTMRRAKPYSTLGLTRSCIKAAISIHDRPGEVASRATFGHWEGDLLSGAAHSHIATLVERRTRFVLLVKLAGKSTQAVVPALVQALRTFGITRFRSLTWDRGMELADHAALTTRTKVPVYFCDPRSPWQRGSNENTNGLLRQYFPDGTDLTTLTDARLQFVAARLNARPRKVLGYRAPGDLLQEAVATTC